MTDDDLIPMVYNLFTQVVLDAAGDRAVSEALGAPPNMDHPSMKWLVDAGIESEVIKFGRMAGPEVQRVALLVFMMQLVMKARQVPVEQRTLLTVSDHLNIPQSARSVVLPSHLAEGGRRRAD